MVDPLGHRARLEEWQRERIAAGNDRQFDREPLRDFIGYVDQIRQVVDGRLDAADAREVRADSDQSDALDGKDFSDYVQRLRRQDSFAEISEVDHQHDVVDDSSRQCCSAQSNNRRQLGVEADVRVADRVVDLVQRRCADQHQGNGDAVAANAGQVVQAGVGDLRDAAADHCSRHLGGATCRFADARHLNTLGIGRFDEDARILFDTTQVDGDGRSGHDLPVFSEGGSRSGHSRPDGWRELDNFAPTVVSQDTYVQYEDTAVSYQAL